MGIETKVIIKISCDFPGCTETLEGGSFEYATFRGWSRLNMMTTLNHAGWEMRLVGGKTTVLCREHVNAVRYLEEVLW